MPILRITKEQVRKAYEARRAALKKDPDFRAFEEKQERLSKKAAKQQEQEKGAP